MFLTSYRQYSNHVREVTITKVRGYEILKFLWRTSQAYSSSKSNEQTFIFSLIIVILLVYGISDSYLLEPNLFK